MQQAAAAPGSPVLALQKSVHLWHVTDDGQCNIWLSDMDRHSVREADAASRAMHRKRVDTRPTCRHWKSSRGGGCSRAHGGISSKLCRRSWCHWRWRFGSCIVLQLYVIHIIHPRVCCCARGPGRRVHGIPGINTGTLEHAARDSSCKLCNAAQAMCASTPALR